jgi:hypothetical protein
MTRKRPSTKEVQRCVSTRARRTGRRRNQRRKRLPRAVSVLVRVSAVDVPRCSVSAVTAPHPLFREHCCDPRSLGSEVSLA